MTAIRSTLLALACLLMLTLSVGSSVAGMAFDCDGSHCAELMQDASGHETVHEDVADEGCGTDCGPVCLQVVMTKPDFVVMNPLLMGQFDRRGARLLLGSNPDLPERPPSVL
ncbi:hypothetical protein [Aliiroseovarius crassostreae]|uniref:hypothetical protein n=1 Tax=Aliiroseovarius crassostreae TaxID=154981 RepID=UPI003C7A5292